MFDKFGEFDSYKEINTLADNLFNEGDQKSLKIMAAENGIPEMMVDMYLQGETQGLCDPVTAAIGKIEIEAEELKPEEIMVSDGELRETQMTNYFSNLYPIDCAVLSVNAQFYRKYGTLPAHEFLPEI